MARRKKSSPFEDLMALVALLPWWGGVTLALVAYLGLHQVARQPVPVPTDPQMGALLQHSLWRGLASVGQYVVPIICLVGAAASALRRRQRRALVENVSANPTADTLDGMDWQTFELLVGEIFRRQGFQVVETGGGGPDGGVDLVLRREAKPTWCSASSGAPTGWA
jgi:restriction system protein